MTFSQETPYTTFLWKLSVSLGVTYKNVIPTASPTDTAWHSWQWMLSKYKKLKEDGD